jgi:hypothetical protein
MSRIPAASHDPDIVASAQALRRAARRALALGLSTGTPVYVLKDGKIEDLTQTVSAYKTRQMPQAVREAGAAYGAARLPRANPPQRSARKK